MWPRPVSQRGNGRMHAVLLADQGLVYHTHARKRAVEGGKTPAESTNTGIGWLLTTPTAPNATSTEKSSATVSEQLLPVVGPPRGPAFRTSVGGFARCRG